MYKFVDFAGEMFKGQTHLEVVRTMGQRMWLYTGKRRFMDGVAARVKILSGGKDIIETRTCGIFLRSLTHAGWLTRKE